MQDLTNSQLLFQPQDNDLNQRTLSNDPASLLSVVRLQNLLRNTKFHCISVIQLEVESLEYKYRIFLRSPYLGNYTAIAKVGTSSFLLPDSNQSITLDPSRVIFEAEKVKAVRNSLPPGYNVTVPEIYHVFNDEKIVIMEDLCFELKFHTLESLLLSKECLNQKLTKEIGSTIGRFLAWLHTWNTNNSGETLDFFRRNELKESLVKGTTICLANTLLQNGGCVSSELSNPPKSMGSVLSTAKSVEDDMFAVHDNLIVGNFRPANILVELDPGQPDHLKRLIIPNWAFSTTGVPGFDIGMICCQLNLFMSLCDNVMEASWSVLSNFLNAYAQVDNPNHSRDSLARNALAYWGMNIVWMTPSYSWIDQPSAQSNVEEGVKWLIGSRDPNFVKGSFVRVLLSKEENGRDAGTKCSL